MIGFSFGSLWVVGWISVILLVSSISRDFKYGNKNLVEQEIVLTNPKVNKLEITTSSPLEKYTRSRWLSFEPFSGLDGDTFIELHDRVFLHTVELYQGSIVFCDHP